MKKDWCSQEFKTLLALGESTTAGGWSSCRERRWTNLLADLINDFQRLPVQLVNVGIGANVISNKVPSYESSGKPAANERLEAHVLENTANGNVIVPDLLVISYGLNDARGGTPIAQFRAEMEDLIRRVRERVQPLIVLLGPYHMVDFDLGGPRWSHANVDVLQRFNREIQSIAESQQCLFVDLLAAHQGADWLVHHDGVHANDLGHRVIANKIFEVLASNCSGLSLETRYLEEHITPWRDESVLQA